MAKGMVKVDGETVLKNMLVSARNKIQVGSRTGINTPAKENTRIWLFNKPKGFITSHFDPQRRPTVFQKLRALGLNIPHLIAVGRLDFNSEGLMIITNNGELSQALERPSYKIERGY
jgi:23S rRNA pseudouridine2605 synthase